MKPPSIVLNHGRKVVLERLCFSQTYAGVMEGGTDAATRQIVIGSAVAKAEEFGRPVHLLQPPLVDLGRSNQARLPWFQLLLGLASGALPGRSDQSQLTVVLYLDDGALDLGAIGAELYDLDWDAHAESFDPDDW